MCRQRQSSPSGPASVGLVGRKCPPALACCPLLAPRRSCAVCGRCRAARDLFARVHVRSRVPLCRRAARLTLGWRAAVLVSPRRSRAAWFGSIPLSLGSARPARPGSAALSPWPPDAPLCSTGCALLCPALPGSALPGSARLCSARLCPAPARLGSVLLCPGSARLGSALPGSARLCSALPGSVLPCPGSALPCPARLGSSLLCPPRHVPALPDPPRHVPALPDPTRPGLARRRFPRHSRRRATPKGVSRLPLDSWQRGRCHDVAALCADLHARDLLAECGCVDGAVDLDL